MTAALALLASLLWGGADFLGGTATRRLPSHLVVLVSQGAALLGLVPVAVAVGGFGVPPSAYLGWAVAAGLVGVGALVAFYSALATGTMGVVAPIAALGVVLPVVVGLASGEQPRALQVAGIAVAVVGVVLASGPELRPGRGGSRPLVLAAVAAVGFGGVILLLAHGARGSAVMTLLVMRLTSVTLLGAAVLGPWGPAPAPVRRADLPLLVAVGAGDVTANACFAVASRSGLLAVVAVLSSLYPAVTVVLAREVHGESLRPVQLLGVVGALAGVVLIAAGGGTG